VTDASTFALLSAKTLVACGAKVRTTSPMTLPSASSAKMSVAACTVASLSESLSTVTARSIVADAEETSRVMTTVPQCPTWTGSVLVNQTLR
jgi:hypothetical protein